MGREIPDSLLKKLNERLNMMRNYTVQNHKNMKNMH